MKIATVERKYGQYVMKIEYFKCRSNYAGKPEAKRAQVTMFDLGEMRFPLIYSKSMTFEQANAEIGIFEQRGYIKIAE